MIKARVRKVKITRLALGVFAVLAANANAQTCSEVIGDSNGLSLTYPSNVGNEAFICGWEDTTDEGVNAISLTVKGYNDGIIIGGYSLTGGSVNPAIGQEKIWPIFRDYFAQQPVQFIFIIFRDIVIILRA